ncbi:MAG TPA: RidA family protein [Alphaproteobacteria bacterium]|nr:RidA family protein [Alphaproteobacteria bacterium]
MSTQNIADKLKELGLELPETVAPVANYVPYVVSGKHVYVAGQIPLVGGKVAHVAKVGADYTTEQAMEAAKVCALNILAQVNAAVGGDWSKVKRCVKLGAFVNSTPDFIDQSSVANGASDLMVAVMGEAGKHARFAVSAPSLPRGVAVEVDAVFELN